MRDDTFSSSTLSLSISTPLGPPNTHAHSLILSSSRSFLLSQMPSRRYNHGSKQRRRLGSRVISGEGQEGGDVARGRRDVSVSSVPGTGGEDQHPEHTYKTEMCNNWIEFGSCRYNGKCRFAHGEDELRVARRIKSDKNWKSELCRNYHAEGTCSYGRRCHFIHDESPEELQRMHAMQKRIASGANKKKDKSKNKKHQKMSGCSANNDNNNKHKKCQKVMPRTPIKAHTPNQETKFNVNSPSSSAKLASGVDDINLLHLKLNPSEKLLAEPSSSSFSFSSSYSPMPIMRKHSLQQFCHLVGLPIEENPNEAESVLPSGESPPFLLRPQSTFGHMQGKVLYEPKIPYTLSLHMHSAPRAEDNPSVESKHRTRLPVFARIASDTGVMTSPITLSP